MNGYSFPELGEGENDDGSVVHIQFTTCYPLHAAFPTCQFLLQTLNSLSLTVCAWDLCCSQFQLLLVYFCHNVLSWRLRLQSSKEQQQQNRMMVFDYVRNLGNQEHPQVLLITVFVAVLCLCLIIGHLLEENRWVNESITAILTVTSLSLSLSLSCYK